jgi:hypothetical protein
MRFRLLWYFTRKVGLTNLLLSALATGLVQAVGLLYSGRLPTLGPVLSQLVGVSLTAGFVLATYFYHHFRRHEMSMYHNYGVYAWPDALRPPT